MPAYSHAAEDLRSFQTKSPALNLGTAVAAMMLLIFFSANGSHAFIYFQF